MKASDFPIGTTCAALVTNFYGVYEVQAVVTDNTFDGTPRFYFRIPMVRGKNGKESYEVVGLKHEEDAGFCLI